MKFIIRNLLIMTMLTTQSYGAERVAQVPEKTIFETIIEAIFPENATEEPATTALTTKPVEKVADKTSENTESNKPVEKSMGIKPTEQVAKKTTEENVENKSKEKATAKPLPEITMGQKDAPVVMINYSSLSCGHCAHFHTDILPQIEEKYIKPGYLRIVFRDYPGDQISLRAHQLAWCKGEMKYLDFMKILYTNQEKWLTAPDPVVALKAIALQNGIPDKQFETCLKNQELLDQIIAIRLEGQKKYNITATPTIVVNAKIYQKALTLEEIDDIMKPLLVSSVIKPKGG